MRAAVIPGALAMASLTVSVGCGAEQQSVRIADSAETSARFSDVTSYGEGGKQDEVIKGAFSWATGEGWAEGRYGQGRAGLLLQVGADCCQQDAQQWKHWRAGGNRPLCSEVFEPPPELLADLRSYGTLERVGEDDVGETKTTHYRVAPKEESDDDPEQWLEVWLDKGDVVHKLNRPAGESSPRTRDYFDFGVGVHVSPPCRVIHAGSRPSTTLSRDKDKLPPCEEESG